MRSRLIPALLVLSFGGLSVSTTAQPSVTAPAAEPVDSAAVAFLKAEIQERGRVMEHARWLTEIHGARLTGSPQLDAAQHWAVGQFRSWGLEAEREAWGEFGRGWTLERSAVMAYVEGEPIAETAFIVYAVPKAWSPAASGRGAEVVEFVAETEADFERYRGQLAGKVVLASPIEEIDLGFEALAHRHDAESLLELANRGLPTPSDGGRRYSDEALARYRFAQARLAFLIGENPLAILEPSSTDGGALRVMAAQVPAAAGAAPGQRPQPWRAGATTVTQYVVMPEHYNRLLRLVQEGQAVRLDLDLEVLFHDDDPTEHNVIAEIPGTDPAIGDEVVMIGAHLDSWHAGTGATDNAAGSSVVMEAARALQAFYDERGEGPRRTIRFALWGGEEQGLYGSVGYVNRRYATSDGYGQPPTALGPEHHLFSAYYNMDNGTGRFRGVYLQGNADVEPIFRAWLTAFDDSTAQTLSPANTGGTDHLAFDAAGLPGFQFIQDRIAYGTQTWHTSLDTFDHLIEEDLAQAAAVMAVFAHHTAERDEKLPRKPLQLAPEPTAGTN
jgi:carboxypeptidase Q